MARFDHDSGSRSRTIGAVYPRDFPLDTQGSQHGLLDLAHLGRTAFFREQVVSVSLRLPTRRSA